MINPYFHRAILSGALILALGACAHKSQKSVKTDNSVEATSPLPQQTVLLQEARAENGNLRGELSSLKILMAKQTGELQSFRKQSQSIQKREQNQGQELQNIRSQLLSSQAERDQLRKHNMELQGQVSSMPDTSQLVSNIQSLRASFQTLMSNMKGLVADMRLIKQEMRLASKKPKPRQTKLTNNLPTASLAKNRMPDTKGRIVVQSGDTLWKLSRTYHVSISQIRKWNSLSSDLIVTGNRLKVVEQNTTVNDQPGPVKMSTKSSAPMAKRNIQDAVSQDTPDPDTTAPVNIPSEPTHILSVTPPQSESDESP